MASDKRWFLLIGLFCGITFGILIDMYLVPWVAAHLWGDSPDPVTRVVAEVEDQIAASITLDSTAPLLTYDPHPIVFYGDGYATIFEIRPDGTVVFGEGMTKDRASREFWRWVAQDQPCREASDGE